MTSQVKQKVTNEETLLTELESEVEYDDTISEELRDILKRIRIDQDLINNIIALSR